MLNADYLVDSRKDAIFSLLILCLQLVYLFPSALDPSVPWIFALRLEGLVAFVVTYCSYIFLYYPPGGTVAAAVDLLKERGAEISQIKIVSSLGQIYSPCPFV